MAGIIGYYDPDGILSPDALDIMASAQFHHESYSYKYEKREWGAIGIIDDATNGHSKIARSSDGKSCVVCRGDSNGDDYNYPITDIKLLQRKGHFASAVLHDESKTINLINDRFGLYPIYIARYKNALIFASEQKSLLVLNIIATDIDQISVSLIISIGELCGDRTLFQNIKTLPSATVLTACNDGISTRKYWQYKYEVKEAPSWRESVEQVSESLERAVRRISTQHHDIGVPLSGGLDSRLLLALAKKKSNVTSYTWGVDYSKDVKIAKNVAQQLGSKHNEIHVNGDYLATMAPQGVWLTEGLTSATNFHVLPHVDYVSGKSSVVLDGLAGDAILGGNFIADGWLHTLDANKAAENIWHWRHSGWLGDFASNDMEELSNPAREEFIKLFHSYSGKTPMDQSMAFLLDNRVRRNSICGTEILRSKLITYHPFFDNDFIDTVSVLPHQWRRRHKFYLAVLKQLSPEAASIVWDRTALPASAPYWMSWSSLAIHKVLSKASNKFNIGSMIFNKSPSPFSNWFRDNLSNYVSDLLLDERTLNRGWVPRDLLIKAVTGHMNQEFNASSFIGSMISLELFARLFIDDLPSAINTYSKMKGDPFSEDKK